MKEFCKSQSYDIPDESNRDILLFLISNTLSTTITITITTISMILMLFTMALVMPQLIS